MTEAVTGGDVAVHDDEGEDLTTVAAAESFNLATGVFTINNVCGGGEEGNDGDIHLNDEDEEGRDLMAEPAAGVELLMTDAVNIDEDEMMEDGGGGVHEDDDGEGGSPGNCNSFRW